MRVVIQRVSEARVSVKDAVVGSIGRGVVLLLGIEETDDASDIAWLVPRIAKLRIWENSEGRMALSLAEIDGEALVVSQFTLFGSLKKGNRPSFNRAALPELAESLYKKFIDALSHELGKEVPSGQFGADMKVALENDGPVTLIVDTQQRDF